MNLNNSDQIHQNDDPTILKNMTLKILPVIFQQQQQQQQHPQSSRSSPLILSPLAWMFLNRRRRILLITLCSPVLLPLLFLSLPLICLCYIYVCLCRCLRSLRRRDYGGLRRCEEGREDDGDDDDEEEREIGWMLLQRYLEDQLGLVGSVVSVYDCGATAAAADDDHQINDDSRTPFLD